jgi:hypothetical protein
MAARERPSLPILLWTTRRSDIADLVIGSAFGSFYLCGEIVLWWPTTLASEGLSPGRIITAALLPAWVAWGLCMAAGAVSRLRDTRPAMRADQHGVRFHPSLGPAATPWSQVRSVRIVPMGRSSALDIALNHRHWSAWAFLPSTHVRLHLASVGLTYRDGRQVVRVLNDARRRSGPTA